MASIYRFKFSPAFMAILEDWVKIHKYDENEIFQDNWMVWCRSNEMLIETEKERLLNLGCKKDIYNKMYKTVRYYLKNKSIVKNAPKERRMYVSLSRDFLDEIDTHVSENVNICSPKIAFEKFQKTSTYERYSRISLIDLKQYGLNEEEISAKIKKTYKNRYFIFKKNKD